MVLPRGDLLTERRRVGNASVETLLFERIELDFCHVEPAPVNWREVKFELVEQAVRFGWLEKFVEGGRLVRTEVVQYHPDAVGIRVVLIGEMLDELHPVLGGSPIFDPHRSPADERF